MLIVIKSILATHHISEQYKLYGIFCIILNQHFCGIFKKIYIVLNIKHIRFFLP